MVERAAISTIRKRKAAGEIMKDSRGRTIDYMRISITDRCNLRCKYCMPYGTENVPRWDILTLEEIEAIAVCGAGLGIRHIKVTGGEPLVRKDCCRLVRRLKAVPGIEKVTITTNGVLLGQYLDELSDAGIDGINISLDTVDRNLYQEITGTDALETVINVIKQASTLAVPVKINAVSINFKQNEGKSGDWQTVAELAREYPVDVRFIEMMPIGYGKNFKTIDHQELLASMKKAYPAMEKDDSQHGFGPAVYYRVPGFKGSLGLISAIHGPFCSSCNRVRLTSQGYLKTCLCYEDGVDLRNILRHGEERPETAGHYHWPPAGQPFDGEMQREMRKKLSHAMEQAILGKPAAHCFENPEQITEAHNMSDIGG